MQHTAPNLGRDWRQTSKSPLPRREEEGRRMHQQARGATQTSTGKRLLLDLADGEQWPVFQGRSKHTRPQRKHHEEPQQARRKGQKRRLVSIFYALSSFLLACAVLMPRRAGGWASQHAPTTRLWPSKPPLRLFRTRRACLFPARASCICSTSPVPTRSVIHAHTDSGFRLPCQPLYAHHVAVVDHLDPVIAAATSKLPAKPQTSGRFEIDTKRMGGHMDVTDGLSVEKLNSDYEVGVSFDYRVYFCHRPNFELQTACCTPGFSSGVHTWEVTIDRYARACSPELHLSPVFQLCTVAM